MQVPDRSAPLSDPSAYDQRLAQLADRIRAADFHFLPGAETRDCLQLRRADALADWAAFAASWNDMPLDTYMADGGRYRRRRYAVLSAAADSDRLVREPHQPHYQSLEYNRLNGGIPRYFEPIAPEILTGPSMQTVLEIGLGLFRHLFPRGRAHVEVHQFRIEAGPATPGLPTPEGAHRDGTDFVLVMMVRRVNIASGTTEIFDLAQRRLDSFTLTDPLDTALVNDRKVMHGVTPIEPLDPTQLAYRDVLVATYRNSA